MFRRSTPLPKVVITAPSIDAGVAHHQAGRLSEAEAVYRGILSTHPDNVDALHLLGVIAIQRGRAQEAVDLISQSLAGNPENAHALNHLGEAFRAMNCLDEATTCYERALKLDANHFQSYNNLGNVYQAQGKTDSAIICYQKAIAANPDYAEAHVNLGNVFQERGMWNLAIECYQRALAIRPDFAEALFNLGNVYKISHRQEEAIPLYERAIALKPDFANGYLALARALQEVGDRDGSIARFRQACALEPENPEARWGLVLTELALVHDNPVAVEDYRAAFARGLDDLDTWFTADRMRDGFNAIGTIQPFYLAYHEQNNRDLIARFGALCGRLASRWQDDQKLVLRRSARGSRIRVGIVSAHVCDHSVWNAITKGWIRHIDQQRIELHIFSLGTARDRDTELAQARASRFVQGATNTRQWAEAILAQPLDVLIYPEIGMDPMTARLANLRLAPVQVTTWGHPETSGLPTIDYYLSAAEFEPEHVEDYYTERLVRLPNLGCCYEALETATTDLSLASLGIDTASPVFVCPGTPFKYAPEHDRVFVEIARALGRCQFVFFNYSRPRLSQQLMQRLQAAFAKAGMDSHDFVVEIKWLDRAQFQSMMRQADLYLDTIGFSGFNTAMQAIEAGLPIVAREGRFMRGRFGTGILRRIGMTELIAESDEALVELVTRLARDPDQRRSLRDRMQNSRQALFDDVAPVRALDDFLTKVAQ
jgi:protein O-GlcNAc transferase